MSSPSPVREREHELNFASQVPAGEERERQVGGHQAPLRKAAQLDSRSNGVFENQTSEKARQLLADIERVARRPYNILITGETGTGKTLAARQIHQRSERAGKPFLELNCASLPEHLVEAELFGYRKGAFTGADRDHKGLFEEADGGILFLDEIGDIAPAVQNKLLKAIDEKQIKRLGTNRYTDCNVQIIAATSRDLPEMIRRGEFREDLYCRLAVLTIETAPLRERREDIPAIIDCCLRDAARAGVAGSLSLSKSYRIEPEAVELLCGFDFPGNIRVLRNLIYELTSYVTLDEPITAGLVAAALDKIRSRELRMTANIVASVRDELQSVLARSDTVASNLQDAIRIWSPLTCAARGSKTTLAVPWAMPEEQPFPFNVLPVSSGSSSTAGGDRHGTPLVSKRSGGWRLAKAEYSAFLNSTRARRFCVTAVPCATARTSSTVR